MNDHACIVYAREALEVGNTREAKWLLDDLIEATAERRIALEHSCEGCGRRFQWPGQLQHHEDVECWS